MKLPLLALALGASLALHPSDGRAQSDTTPSRPEQSRAVVRNPNAARNGPPTGVSLGFKGFGRGGLSEYPTVVRLASGGSGERAGLMVGDTIRAVNGRDARQIPVFPNRVPGARYVVRIRRGGEDREVTLVLPATPAAPPRRR